MKTLTRILGIGAVLLPLALTGCKRQLEEPVRSNYREGNTVTDNRGHVWFPQIDSNGIIQEVRPVEDNTPIFVREEDVKSGKFRQPDGTFVIYLTPGMTNIIEAQRKLAAELGYQIAKAKYDTLKLNKDREMAKGDISQ
jgi:hypothetical protein